MQRCMIIGNQTLGGQALEDAVRERMAAGPCEFFVVVPATCPADLAPFGMPNMGGVALTIPATDEKAHEVATQRLAQARETLGALGATVDGEVGDADPMVAARDCLRSHEFDEIIVSALPVRLSRWLRQDLPRRLHRKFQLPVTEVVAVKAPARTG